MERLQLIQLAWKCTLGGLENNLGADHIVFLILISRYSQVISTNSLPEDEKKRIYATLQALLRDCQSRFGYDPRTFYTYRVLLLFTYNVLNEPEEAERTAKEIVDQLMGASAIENMPIPCQEDLLSCWTRLAIIASRRGQRELAATYWRQAIFLGSHCRGLYHPATVRYFLALETELAGMGMDLEVEKVREQRNYYLQGFLRGTYEFYGPPYRGSDS